MDDPVGDDSDVAHQLGGLTILRWKNAGLPPGLDDLIGEAVRAGHAWIGAFRDEWATQPYLGAGEALLLVLDGTTLVAMAAVGVSFQARDPAEGRLKYIYVGQNARGRGLLRVLVVRCLARADARFRRLTLHTENPVAARVYESYGFRPTTQDGRSIHVREIA